MKFPFTYKFKIRGKVFRTLGESAAAQRLFRADDWREGGQAQVLFHRFNDMKVTHLHTMDRVIFFQVGKKGCEIFVKGT